MVPAGVDTLLRWSSGDLHENEHEGAPAGSLLAADSWLVEGGAVRGYDAHWARFGGWCDELGLAAAELAGFRAAVTAALPRDPGRWFPRVEIAAGGADGAFELGLRLRGAPSSASEARVVLGEPGDPRTCPLCKGPDLERLIALRAQAVAAGADELLLRDADGRLLEGALSSLLWWDGETLCTTPSDRTLPGITRALLLEIARREGVGVSERSPRPDELDGRETWLTSALHGIRVVSAWGPAVRAERWRTELARTARPLDER